MQAICWFMSVSRLFCAENFNKSNRFPISCPYCDYTACRSCYQIWILDNKQPCCISNDCKKVWSRKMLVERCTKKFIATTYKEHRENYY